LFERRTAYEPPVVKLCRGKRPRQSRFAASDPRYAALDEQPRCNDSAPGGDPFDSGWRLVRRGIEVASAACERPLLIGPRKITTPMSSAASASTDPNRHFGSRLSAGAGDSVPASVLVTGHTIIQRARGRTRRWARFRDLGTW